MRIKGPIMQKVAPKLYPYGFTITESKPPEYVFKNLNGSRAISFDTEKYLPKKLRVFYSVIGPTSFSLQLKDFNPQFCPVSVMSYQSQDELINYLENVADASASVILPYLDVMAENYIPSSYDMSTELSNEVDTRINRFAKTHHLSIAPTKSNLEKLDTILDSMKRNISRRKLEFLKNKAEIIDLTAYFGALIAISKGAPGQWKWREVSHGYSRFVIKETGYDPLDRVLLAWNFGSEASSYTLKTHPI